MLPVLSLSPIVEVSVVGVPSPTPARGLWSGQAQGCVKDEPGPQAHPNPSAPEGAALPPLSAWPGPAPLASPVRDALPLSFLRPCHCVSSMAAQAPGALGSCCPECANSFTGHSGVGKCSHPADGETEAPGKLTCPGMLSWEWRRSRARPPSRATRLRAPVFEPAPALGHFSVFCFC